MIVKVSTIVSESLVRKTVEEGTVVDRPENKFVFAMARIFVTFEQRSDGVSARMIESEGWTHGSVSVGWHSDSENKRTLVLTLVFLQWVKDAIELYSSSVHWNVKTERPNGDPYFIPFTVVTNLSGSAVNLVGHDLLDYRDDFIITLMAVRVF